MSKNYWVICIIVTTFCLTMICGCINETTKDNPAITEESTPTNSLIVFCGAGLREPMDEIAQDYLEQTDTEIKYTYGGSAQLLSQIELIKKGDCYMPGAKSYIDSAAKKGFINSSEMILYHVMTIAVQPDNPMNITTLKDLTKEGVRVAIGEPTGPAVGKATKQMLEKYGYWEEMQDNIVVRTGTVNELFVDMSMDQADAAIIWEELLMNTDLQQVQIPVNEGLSVITPIGTLTFSEKKDEAQDFVDFVASEDSHSIFEKYGYETYPSAKYGDA